MDRTKAVTTVTESTYFGWDRYSTVTVSEYGVWGKGRV